MKQNKIQESKSLLLDLNITEHTLRYCKDIISKAAQSYKTKIVVPSYDGVYIFYPDGVIRYTANSWYVDINLQSF
jgi:hypothetical protein